jgi:hypothetical protein
MTGKRSISSWKEQTMKKFLALSSILVLALIAAGCEKAGEDPSSPDVTDDLPLQVIDLDSPTGGFTETDEEPLFGEPETFMALDEGEGEDCDYSDPLCNEEDIRNMERRAGVRIYRFRALWGRMVNACTDAAVTDCCTVDWTGGMKLEGGVIVIERVLKFDLHDELVRTGPNTLRWKSHTCPHVDGVQVRLIVPPAPEPDSTEIAPADGGDEIPEPTLTIVAGPFERTFTMDELESLKLMEPVDRCNNYMTIASYRILPACPRGYMLGRWMKTESPDTLYNEETGEIRGIVLGRFKGIWVNKRGWAVGHLKGIFGVNSAGEHKFFGKYVNPKGEFMGILAGDYGAHPTFAADPLHEMGWFEGLWYGRNHTAKGRLKGEWVTSAAGQGYFKGIWGMLCNEAL